MILHGLAPADLVRAIALCAVVLILFYLLRERRRRVFVPWLPLLEEALGRSALRHPGGWWRRFGSWLLQVVIAALTLFALADPEWAGGGAWRHRPHPSATPGSLALLIDGSASMRARHDDLDPCQVREGDRCSPASEEAAARSSFERAVARAARRIAALPSGSRVLVATFGGDVAVHARWTAPAGALRVLTTLRAADVADDPSAVRSFAAALRRARPDAGVVVYSDLQRGAAWQAARLPSLPGRAPIRLEGVGAPYGNLRVTDLRARADPRSLGQLHVRVSVVNDGPTPSTGRIELATRALDPGEPLVVVEAREVALGALASRTLSFALPPTTAPLLRAQVTPTVRSLDAIVEDSERWAAVPALRPVPVHLHGEPATAVLSALLADPFVWLDADEPTPPADAPPDAVAVFVGEVPERPSAPTLIIAPPVDPAQPLAAAAAATPGPLSAARHPFWGELDPGANAVEAAAALVAGPGERPILLRGDAIVGTVGQVDGVPVIRLGLDPGDPALVGSVLWPALISRAVDHLARRGSLLSEAHRSDRADHDHPGWTAWRRLASSDAPAVPNRAAASPGAYAEPLAAGGTRPRVFIPPPLAGEVEPVGRTTDATELPISTGSGPRRSPLWWWLMGALVAVAVVEHGLFVARRVL